MNSVMLGAELKTILLKGSTILIEYNFGNARIYVQRTITGRSKSKIGNVTDWV